VGVLVTIIGSTLIDGTLGAVVAAIGALVTAVGVVVTIRDRREGPSDE
jgi:hypothetical protein